MPTDNSQQRVDQNRVDASHRRQWLRVFTGAGSAGLVSARTTVRGVPDALSELCNARVAPARQVLAPGQTISGLCLMPGAATANLTGGASSPSNVWAYNGLLPGPMLRVRQNTNTRFELSN